MTAKQKQGRLYALNLAEAAKLITNVLKSEGITVMRYDAFSTRSIYLKLDDGVLGTIRISDHPGKKHLKYKYNLMKTGNKYKKVDNGILRHFYPLKDIELLINRIRNDRTDLILDYGLTRYDYFMQRNRETGEGQKGFWQKAKYV